MRDQSHESFGRRVWSRVRRYLFEDARLKLLALLIVTVIWFGVAGQTRASGATAPGCGGAGEGADRGRR